MDWTWSDRSRAGRIGHRPPGPRRRRPSPADAAAHAHRRPGTLHAFAALDAWYVADAAGVIAVAPDHASLLAWCLRHVAAHSDDQVIIHHDAPCEDAAGEDLP